MLLPRGKLIQVLEEKECLQIELGDIAFHYCESCIETKLCSVKSPVSDF